MDYSFGPYLEALERDWFSDDALLRRLLAWSWRTSGVPEDRRSELSHWGERTAGELRELAEASARPERAPRLERYDPYGRRVDAIVLPASTRRALAVVEGREGLGVPDPRDPFGFYAKTYLTWQNGEAGTACSVGCTDGLVRVLEALGDRPEHRTAVERVRASTTERVWHGAQFVTEIQGGSNIPANSTQAVPEGEHFRIHGRKWFCSNVNADYFLVTARPEGAPPGGDGIGLFLVPAYPEGEAPAPGAPEAGRLPLRNGYTIDRLKDKLGTRELATAEVTFRGALATPVGPLDRGLPNLVQYVLVPSRFACVVSAAGFLRRAERIVTAYASFRTAFGRRIAEYPLVRDALRGIAEARAGALAVTFELLRLWEEDDGTESGWEGRDFRVLLSLAKTALTREATLRIHQAMGVLAGNGIEERFSPLPRLYRDAVIMETWEGPHNVLLTQALRDLVRFDTEPGAFVERVAGEGRLDLVRELDRILVRHQDPETTLRLPSFAAALVRACGTRVLDEAAR